MEIQAAEGKKEEKEKLSHSLFSASSSHRWLKCPGSIKLSMQMPSEKPGPAAQIGTDAHELAEKCLRSGLSAKSFIGCICSNGTEVTRSMAEKIQGFVDYVNEHKLKNPGTLYIEHRVYLPDLDDRLFGTCDAMIISPTKEEIVVHIFDLKFGKWPVKAENNEQMMYYALGAFNEIKNSMGKKVSFFGHIYQPNSLQKGLKKTEKPANVAEYSLQSLRLFAEGIKDAIAAHDAFQLPDLKSALPSKPLNYDKFLYDGEHCRFCKAELICPKLNSFGRKII